MRQQAVDLTGVLSMSTEFVLAERGVRGRLILIGARTWQRCACSIILQANAEILSLSVST